MTVRASRRLLWLALMVLVPFPVFLGVVTAVIPVVRTLMLTGICLLVVITEGTNGVADLFAVMLLGQALCHMAVLWLGAFVLARLLARVAPERLAAVTLILVFVGLVVTTSFSFYRTPFSPTSTRSNLLEVLK